jgi:hypothetical protein
MEPAETEAENRASAEASAPVRPPLSRPLWVVLGAGVALFATPMLALLGLPEWMYWAWGIGCVVVVLVAAFVMLREYFSRPKQTKPEGKP